MAKERMKNRTIRTTDSQWDSYKRLLGDDWFREQITKAERREQRKPVGLKTKERPNETE